MAGAGERQFRTVHATKYVRINVAALNFIDDISLLVLQNVSFLAAYHFAVINSSDYALTLQNFKEYKAQLETSGAILFNPTLEKVLLVTSWYGKHETLFIGTCSASFYDSLKLTSAISQHY